MKNQLPPGIARCTQGADHARFLPDGIADGDSKHKSHDHNHDIKKHDNHSLISAHIITGKNNRLIKITWDKSLQGHNVSNILHEILGNLFLLFFVFWLLIVDPGIIVLEFFLIQSLKFLRGYDSNTKFYRIKHGIIIVLKQSTVIGKRHQTCNLPGFFAPDQSISHLKAVVIRIHSVNSDFTLSGWHFSFHQADLVHLLPVFEETHGASVIQIFFYIIILVKCNTCRLNVFPLRSVNFFRSTEISVFDVIFVKTFVIGFQHTSVSHQEAGHEPDSQDHQQKNHQIFSKFPLQFPGDTFTQRTLHACPLTIPDLQPESSAHSDSFCGSYRHEASPHGPPYP